MADKIVYSYEILDVDEQAKCMLVRYTSEGLPDQLVSTRIPRVGEDLMSVITAYSPVFIWQEMVAEVAPPEVGTTGTVEHNLVQPEVVDVGAEPEVVEQVTGDIFDVLK